MAKKMEERIETVEQELQRLSIMEENLLLISKSIQEINIQTDKQQQQQQMIMKYIEGIIRDDNAAGKRTESVVSQTKGIETIASGTSDGTKDGRSDEEKPADRSKFKKVEMTAFNGTDLCSWLFQAYRYFKIHELSDSEKLTGGSY